MSFLRIFPLVVSSLIACSFAARAEMYLYGPSSNAGDYTIAELQAKATPQNTVSDGTYTGISLWGLLGSITTSLTNPNDNTNNPINRYYVAGIGTGGQTSIVSVGEINPGFGGTTNPNLGTTPLQPFVAFQTAGGTELDAPRLVFPTAPDRGGFDLLGLQLLSVPSAFGVGGPSSSFVLSGDVAAPGAYDLARLQSDEFTPVTYTFQQTPAGTGSTVTYTGIPLWEFLKPLVGEDDLGKIVVVTGSDGYKVVYALAEFDPDLSGSNPISGLLDLLVFGGASLNPASGFARTMLPEDNMRGRWNSNIVSIEVFDAPIETPLPATLPMMASGLGALGFVLYRRAKKNRAARTAT